MADIAAFVGYCISIVKVTPHVQVVAAAVVSMSAEVTAARARLEDLIQRREEIERELEAGAGGEGGSEPGGVRRTGGASYTLSRQTARNNEREKQF